MLSLHLYFEKNLISEGWSVRKQLRGGLNSFKVVQTHLKSFCPSEVKVACIIEFSERVVLYKNRCECFFAHRVIQSTDYHPST